MGLTQGISSLWRPKHRLEINVQFILQVIEYVSVNCIYLAVDRLKC